MPAATAWPAQIRAPSPVPEGSSPSRRRPRMSGLPLPRPGPLAARLCGLLCAGSSRSATGARSSTPRPRPLLPPPPAQLPRAGPATPGAGRSRAHVRSAYLGGGGGGLGGCYRGGCSARNGEQRLGRGRDSADGGGADPPRPCAPGLASSAPGPAPDTAQAWARVPNQLPARTITFLRPQCPPRTRVPAGVCGHAWVLRAPGHGAGEAWG
ncbi:translation initiation factor IF-2-like [Acinonyx jubatus]|uniref:Translation initiation factor IF-2-like n=1 Tax=Acinonyx jubatus TaxID=32536 RepID=A0ABM3PZ98_ACIJB|nr:translation initiation factor IF-2-like [Acinonyx jubatus]